MNKRSALFSYVLFLIWPLLALIISFKKYRATYSANIVWLFCIFFGISFSISSNSQKSDITRYLAGFEELKFGDSDISSITDILYVQYGYNDLYYPFISFFAAKMQLPNSLYLGLLGLVFGYFYSRIYKYFVEEVDSGFDLLLTLFLITFLMIVPIWRGINGIRFSLAAVMFVFGVINMYKDKVRVKYLFVLLLTPFVHFSMISIVLVSGFYLLVRNFMNIKLLFLGYLLSLMIVEVDLDQLNVLLNAYAPSIFSSKIDAYARSSYIGEIEQRTANTNWYALWYFKALNYSIIVLMILIYRNYKSLILFSSNMKFYISYLFFLSIFVNFSSLVPSGGRMSLISIMLTLFFFSILYNRNISNLKKSRLSTLVSPLLLFYILVQLRIGADFISLEALVGNPLVSFLNLEKVSIIDVIK